MKTLMIGLGLLALGFTLTVVYWMVQTPSPPTRRPEDAAPPPPAA